MLSLSKHGHNLDKIHIAKNRVEGSVSYEILAPSFDRLRMTTKEIRKKF